LGGIQLYMLAPLLTPGKGVWRSTQTIVAEASA
jgi:hypothetical protein